MGTRKFKYKFKFQSQAPTGQRGRDVGGRHYHPAVKTWTHLRISLCYLLAAGAIAGRAQGGADITILQNEDGSARFPLVKRTKTMFALLEEMLALYIRLKGLGDQAVTRKEIMAVIMQLLARKEAVNLCGGKFEKLSKVAKRALKRRVLDKSYWPFSSAPSP
ncbi:hypothetical protein T492DRAFT_890868 [Pavlovales sp. CCMP2436]|nr:hypothetical protein T492DRAFT_890868 [Pavlovales sp. CCMP2436]